MAKTWLAISVELLGGRGVDLWPAPGRVFAVGPSHTFEQLAEAINDAFARWDRSHLSVFTLSDGQVVTDEYTGEEFASSMVGPLVKPLNYAAAKVAQHVQRGDEFKFVFDLGDDWAHKCVVEPHKIDPMAELGIRPKAPLPFWGWGSIPDQYGRRWAEDIGDDETPPAPDKPAAMRSYDWPPAEQLPQLNMREVRAALRTGDIPGFLSAISGRDIDHALQQVGPGMRLPLQHQPEQNTPLVAAVINRLTFRSFPGDQELADVLLALLRFQPLEGTVVPVDLEKLSLLLEPDPHLSSGAYVDRNTGEVYPAVSADAAEVGEGLAIDVEQDPERWVAVGPTDPHEGWHDRMAFAKQQRTAGLRRRIEHALEGAGAFQRFRQLMESEGLVDRWVTFSLDRQIGRARRLLSEAGITVAERS